jgi:hypothetical protein
MDTTKLMGCIQLQYGIKRWPTPLTAINVASMIDNTVIIAMILTQYFKNDDTSPDLAIIHNTNDTISIPHTCDSIMLA